MATRTNRFLMVSIGLAVGVVIGQISIIIAFDPYRFTIDSIGLAAEGYRLGCAEARGKDCLPLSADYARDLLKNFNTR